ncbi:MAG: TonB-dependent receptor, partial [Pseudomonadota bacterium]
RQSYGRTFDRPAIRGQSVILGEDTVGLFVDGVYIEGSISSTPLDNIERIEVIKGPQAALYGRATLAGAINYITKKPTDDWSLKLASNVAEHGEYELRAFLNGPIVEDKLAFNLGVRQYEYDGEYDNVGPGGGEVGQEETQSVYGSLYWTPTENFDAELKVTWFEDTDGHPATMLTVESDDLNCFLGSPRGYFCGELPTPSDVEIDLVDGIEYGTFRETLRNSLTLNWDIGGMTLTSQSAYSKEDEDWLLDFGPEANDFFLFTQTTTPVNEEAEYWKQEFRVTSDVGERLRWLVGVYYFESEELDPATTAQDDVENQAIFGSLGYDFSEQWSGTVELRYAEDDITARNSSGVVLNESFDSVTPRFTLSWHQNDDVNYYGSVAKGTKPGGFNAGVLGNDVPPGEQQRLAGFVSYDEEEAWNFEIGTKRTLLDGRMTLNAALFFIDWDDQQLTSAEPFTNTDGEPDTTPLITNIGKTEIMGLEVFWNARLNENFDLNISYGYTDAEIKEQCDSEYGSLVGADPASCDQVRFPGGASVAGNSTPNAPEHNGSVSLAYNRPLAMGDAVEFFARGDYTYESTRFAQVYNLAETGDSARMNLRAGLRSSNWQASVWVKNLTDDDTANSAVRIVDFDTLFFGLRRAFLAGLPRGRQFGASFEYNFDF